MKDPLSLHAVTRPDATALITEDKQYSYKELHKIVCKTTDKLRLLNVSKIAFRTTNPLDTIIIIWACLRARIMFMPLNPSFPDDYIQTFLQDANIQYTTEISSLITLTELNTTQNNEELSEEQLCSIICTSGSSGRPKLAVHSLGNHIASAKSSQKNIPLTPGDIWLLNLPLFHVSGLSIVFRCILAGASISLSPTKPYTHSSLVPTQLLKRIEEKDTLFINSKYCLVGGAAFPENVILPTSPHIFPTYGLTEMSSQVITNNTLLSSANIYIDPETNILWVKGDSLFQGYLNNGLSTLPLNQDGYFNTKDLVTFDTDRFNYIGRQDRMIISGGENIQPEEIEALLMQHPNVTRAAVVGIPDNKFGERPVAFIECQNFTSVKKEVSKLLDELPKFKRPDVIKELPNIAKNTKIKFKNLCTYV